MKNICTCSLSYLLSFYVYVLCPKFFFRGLHVFNEYILWNFIKLYLVGGNLGSTNMEKIHI